MDAIVHDALMLMKRHGSKEDFVMVSIDASNTFNSCSRQSILQRLPTHTPSLDRFANVIYGRTKAHLVVPSSPPLRLKSCEGTQHVDPASMLLSSMAIQQLIDQIPRKCKLEFNKWCADDGLIIGKIGEVTMVLRLQKHESTANQFFLNASKTKAFAQSMSQNALHT